MDTIPEKSSGDNILCVRNILGSRGGSCSTWSRERHGGGFHSPLEPPVVRQTPTEVELLEMRKEHGNGGGDMPGDVADNAELTSALVWQDLPIDLGWIPREQTAAITN